MGRDIERFFEEFLPCSDFGILEEIRAFMETDYLIDVYHDLCKALEVEAEPIFGPERAGDIRDSNADISKARELLGYAPEYDFAKGIHLAIGWYKENL